MNRHRTSPPFTPSTAPTGQTADARDAAVRRIAQREHRRFWSYAIVLAAANALIMAFWVGLALAGRLDMVKIYLWPNRPLPAGFFWPIFPIAICGVLVLASWRRAYHRRGYRPEETEREIARTGTSDTVSSPRSAEGPRPASARSLAPAEPGGLSPAAPTAAPSEVAVRHRGFAVHLFVYAVINSVLIAAWALGGGGFFWPVFLMTVWGVGVLVNGYLAYRPHSAQDPKDSV